MPINHLNRNKFYDNKFFLFGKPGCLVTFLKKPVENHKAYYIALSGNLWLSYLVTTIKFHIFPWASKG